MSVVPSDLVRARGALWRVDAIEQGDRCRAVRLVRAAARGADEVRTLIEPFDRIHLVTAGERTTAVRMARARRIARALLESDRLWREPVSAAGARVDELPWQLVPAIALLEGRSRRVLLADAVGLGKTVQAGFLIREVRERWPASRILILVPAGLRAQWRSELALRFEVESHLADLAWLDDRARAVPHGVNPWEGEGTLVSSFDFAKRHEVLPGPERTTWDLVVIDEAHGLGAGTARHLLAEAVCRRARRVLLLTATPHDGSGARFTALCRIGALDSEPPPLIIRRERRHLRQPFASRRWRVLHVAPGDDETGLRALLERYLARIDVDTAGRSGEVAQLLASLLRKRAASSAWALLQTLERRARLLADGAAQHVQVALPFDAASDDGDLPDDLLAAPAITAVRIERAWLGVLVQAARRAARRERKLEALRRFLRRVREPVLVFTEYRDTLLHAGRRLRDLCDVEFLHGGLSPSDRHRSLSRFTKGPARLLLATDAAGEGLNLHQRCRCVVMLDLPWTPGRLEQRIGRLDRLGQARTVHALALVARDPFEIALAAGLARRIAHADEALARARSDGLSPEQEAEAALISWRCRTRRALRHRLQGLPGASRARAALKGRVRGPAAALDPRVCVACLAARRTPTSWSGLLALLSAELVGPAGVIDRTVVGVHVPSPVPALRRRAAVRAFADTHLPVLTPHLIARARDHVVHRWTRAGREWEACQRHAAAADAADETSARSGRTGRGARRGPALAQPSLFGRYAPAGAAAIPARPAEDALPPVAAADLRERIRVVLVLLRPGPGRAPTSEHVADRQTDGGRSECSRLPTPRTGADLEAATLTSSSTDD